MEADLSILRKKVDDVRHLVYTTTHEIERLRMDMGNSTGEALNAYRLVIQDKLRKMEHALVCMSQSILDHTAYDPAQPTPGEMLEEARMWGC